MQNIINESMYYMEKEKKTTWNKNEVKKSTSHHRLSQLFSKPAAYQSVTMVIILDHNKLT